MIYVVLWSHYDDWDLVGASANKEVAKQLKRDYVAKAPEALRDQYFKHTEIVPCEDGEIRTEPYDSA